MLGRVARAGAAGIRQAGIRTAWTVGWNLEVGSNSSQRVVTMGRACSWKWRREMSGSAAMAIAREVNMGGMDMVGPDGGRQAQLDELLADPNPANHRPGDAGKVFRLNKEELKELFPGGISGAMHLILFGTRSRLPQAKRRGDDWWHVILKQSPGTVIRKEAVHLMSALHAVSRMGVAKGDPKTQTPGFLIDGAKGTGKSTILNHVVHWAVKTNEWVVIYVPHASDLVSGKGFYERDGEKGEFILQPAYAVKYLGTFLSMNEDKFSQLQVKLDGGEVDIATAIRNLTELPLVEREQQAMGVFEKIIDALKAQNKFPVLVAIDEFNALHGMSLYRDAHMQYVPSQNVKLASLLGKFLDANYKRGVVLGAAVRQGQFAHVKLPEFNAKPIQVRGFTMEELRTYITYMYLSRDMFTPITTELVEYLMFCTAGRPLDVEKACSHEIFNLGLRNDNPKIRNTKFYQEGGFEQDLITDPAIGNLT